MHVATSGSSAAAASDDPSRMRVSELRRTLEGKGGDCDGSRELLEKRLREPADEAPRKKARAE